MIEKDIKEFITCDYILSLFDEEIKNIKLIGEMDFIIIKNNYKNLDLSNVNCKEIQYCPDYLNDNLLTHKFPNNIERITIHPTKRSLNKLPLFPDTIKELNIQNTNISSIFNDLPDHIEELDISNNKFEKIHFPILNELSYLNCSNNEIIDIDINGLLNLETLICDSNKIKYLYKLPTYLSYLSCYNNPLKFINFSNTNGKLTFNYIGNIDYMIPNLKNKFDDISSSYRFKLKSYPHIIDSNDKIIGYCECLIKHGFQYLSNINEVKNNIK